MSSEVNNVESGNKLYQHSRLHFVSKEFDGYYPNESLSDAADESDSNRKRYKVTISFYDDRHHSNVQTLAGINTGEITRSFHTLEEAKKYASSFKNLESFQCYEIYDKQLSNFNLNSHYDFDEAGITGESYFSKAIKCKWLWKSYSDGSGKIISPEGKRYFIYDIFTHEF